MYPENLDAKEQLKDKILGFFGKHFYISEFDIPLKKLFPEPEDKVLQGFWSKKSHADIPVFSRKTKRLAAIFETGGTQHLKKKQRNRDTLKAKLCELNNVGFRGTLNWEWRKSSKRKLRNWIRKALYP